MKKPKQLINERRKWLEENSIDGWNDTDTISVMQKYLKEAKLEASKISSNAVLKVTSDSKKNKKKSEVAVCDHFWTRDRKTEDGKIMYKCVTCKKEEVGVY